MVYLKENVMFIYGQQSGCRRNRHIGFDERALAKNGEEIRKQWIMRGIGGIRRGFELAGGFENVLSAEKDEYACKTYQHLFGDDPDTM